jgi:ABC-type polysaccharide/polyol phosphate export permease
MASLVAIGTRYRQTILGPWWITLMTLAFVLGLAVLRVGLGGGDLREAIPYVGLGFIIFGLISGGVGAAAGVFRSSGARLSSVARPLSFYVFKSQSSQVLDFAHDAVAILVIVLVFAISFSVIWAQSVLVVCLIILGAVGMSWWLGPAVARSPDLGPIVGIIMRLAFFLTPIFWSIDELAEGRSAWAWWNPFTYLLLAFRDPILGTTHPGAPIDPLLFTALWAVLNLAIGFVVFSLTSKRVPYWVLQ